MYGHPLTATDIYKVEAVQRRATRDYNYTSSVSTMSKDLSCRPLEQRRIDSRLRMMYKVRFDLVAIPTSEYLIPNTTQSRHIHALAYRQIPTLKDYYKFTFHPGSLFIGMLYQPTNRFFQPWHSLAILFAR